MANTQTDTKQADKKTTNSGATAAPTRQRKRQKVESMMARPWKPENEGDCLEGIYLGSEMVKGKGKRPSFKSYHIEIGAGDEKGTRVRIASAMLNSKLNQIPKNTYVWLTYKGMFQTDNGPSPDYEVEAEEGTELIDPLQGDGTVREETV